jgi:hypothetical protein
MAMPFDLRGVPQASMAADVGGLSMGEVLSAVVRVVAAQASANALLPAFPSKLLGSIWWPLTKNSLMSLGRSTVAAMVPGASVLSLVSLISVSLRSCRRQAS